MSLECQILENVSLVIPNEMMPKNLSLERQILTQISWRNGTFYRNRGKFWRMWHSNVTFSKIWLSNDTFSNVTFYRRDLRVTMVVSDYILLTLFLKFHNVAQFQLLCHFCTSRIGPTVEQPYQSLQILVSDRHGHNVLHTAYRTLFWKWNNSVCTCELRAQQSNCHSGCTVSHIHHDVKILRSA